MSREQCSRCGRVVSTTYDPNTREGWFIDQVTAERLESEEHAASFKAFPRIWLNQNTIHMVLCDECQEEKSADKLRPLPPPKTHLRD